MVNWRAFTPSDFEYDFENDELEAHGIRFEEAVECFFSDFTIRRNKSYRDRYQLVGRTIAGPGSRLYSNSRKEVPSA